MNKQFITAVGSILLLASCGNSSQSTVPMRNNEAAGLAIQLPSKYRMVTKHGQAERVLVVWNTIKDYQDIDRVVGNNLTYKKFLQESWNKFEAEAPAAELQKNYKAQPILPQDVGYCSVSVGTFSNLPITNTVSGSYKSQCTSAGNATIINATHTLTVQNNTTRSTNSASRTSSNGNIYYLGAPVPMSFGGNLYCARGYHSARTLDGRTFSYDTYWLCDYWNS